MGIGKLWIPGYLVFLGLATQLQHIFVDLSQAGGTDGLSVGDTAAVRVNRHTAAYVRFTGLDQGFLLAMFAETILRHVHDLCTYFRVLQLHNIDISWADTRHFKGGL